MSEQVNDAHNVYTNDEWTIIDELGFEPCGDQLARIILLATPPFAIGVNGKWGSGKTSIMRYAMARLGGLPVESLIPGQKTILRETSGAIDQKWNDLFDVKKVKEFIKETTGEDIETPLPIRCVWFNTWQYQNDVNPMVPLLHEIRRQMSAWLRSMDKIGKNARVIVESGLEMISRLTDSALKMLSIPSGFSGLPEKIRTIGQRVEDERFETITDAQRFNLQFEKAVQLVLNVNNEPENKSDLKRLVIFIDDLDRCEENKVLTLLEMIKLYLSTKYCVFVLGIDREAVERAVSRVWKDRSDHESREYIEKLFQAMLHVPVSDNYEDFVEKRLQLDYDDNTSGNSQHLDSKPKKSLAKLICRLLEPNPRKIKNFINSLNLMWALNRKQWGRYDPPDHVGKFVLIHYLRCFFPDVYRLIAQDPGKIEILVQVLAEASWDEDYQTFRFFQTRFLHILKTSEDNEEDRGTAVELYASLLDRHKGDRKFAEAFKKIFNEVGQRSPEIVKILCCTAVNSQPETTPSSESGVPASPSKVTEESDS